MRLELVLARPSEGYYGEANFTRRALPFAAGEALRVTLVQADWRQVVFGDWRFLHGVLSELRMCGVPQSDEAYARREKAFAYEQQLAACARGEEGAHCEGDDAVGRR